MSNVSGSVKDGLDGHQSDQMLETKRKSRNMSEKKRRDQFNALINDLAAMVSPSDAKLDKSSVLKAAVNFLQSHNASNAPCESVDIGEAWKPPVLSNEEFIHLMLEAVDGFLVAVASDGEILHCSENIVSILGHLPSDLVNNSVFGMLYSTEAPEMYRRLANSANVVNESFDSDESLSKQDSLSPPSSCLHLDPSSPGFRKLNVGEEGREMGDATDPKMDVEFSCHFKRHTLSNNLPYTPPSYEKLKFRGFFKTCNIPAPARDSERLDGPKGETPRRRPGKNSQVDALDVLEKRRVLIATGQVVNPQFIREMPPLVDTIKGEFISRHSLEWKFLFLDHRAPPIIGYLPFELLGTSGYDYYHLDDLERISESHETLMETGDGQSCCYRFLTKGQEYIWLQSSYFISYHQWTAKPEFIVCTNRVVSYGEVRSELERERAAELIDHESMGSLTYRSSPGFSSEASSYCTNKTGSNVGDPGGTPTGHVRHMKSPSSSASSTVSSSVACGTDANAAVAAPNISKQQNLLHSVVGALVEETRLAVAVQTSTSHRKSKSAIVTPFRPFNEADVDGFREPFAYQQPAGRGQKRSPSGTPLGIKRPLSPPPPQFVRNQPNLLSPPAERSFPSTIQANLVPADSGAYQVPFRSTSQAESKVEVAASCAVAPPPSSVEILAPYDLPPYSGPSIQDGMYFIQPQIQPPHLIQVPLVQSIVSVPAGTAYVTATTCSSATSLPIAVSSQEDRSAQIVLKSEHDPSPCAQRPTRVGHVLVRGPLASSGDVSSLPPLIDPGYVASPLNAESNASADGALLQQVCPSELDRTADAVDVSSGEMQLLQSSTSMQPVSKCLAATVTVKPTVVPVCSGDSPRVIENNSLPYP